MTRPQDAGSPEEATAIAGSIGYAVVLKVFSPDIAHKTDVGGVALDLQDEAAVRAAFERVTDTARRARPDARVEGVTVQRMVSSRDGLEMIVGAKQAPVFGAVILVGMGRLIADPDHETAEYAVLVSDAWQNRGLGAVLTDTCLEIARGWGLRRMVAETTSDNERMLSLFRSRGFEITSEAEGLAAVTKELEPLAPVVAASVGTIRS